MCDPTLQAEKKTVISTEICLSGTTNGWSSPTGHSALTPVKRMAQIEEFLEKQCKPSLKNPQRQAASLDPVREAT